ncbi:MAG TPA: hypothetical protein VH744_11330, partial [Terriglobales bacterium]
AELTYGQEGNVTTARLIASGPASIRTLARTSPAPFLTVRDLLTGTRPDATRRVRLRGTVLKQIRPSGLCWTNDPCLPFADGALVMDDGSAVIAVKTADATMVQAGDRIEAEGYASPSGLWSVVLESANFRVLQAPPRAAGRHFPSAKAGQAGSTPILRTAKEVLRLDIKAADQARPVNLEGVITYYDPRYGFLFVQDASAGIYVRESYRYQDLRVGDKVRIAGFTAAGEFSPVIRQPAISKLGTSSLPEPQSVSLHDATLGAKDAQWVELTGTARRSRTALLPGSGTYLNTNVGLVAITTPEADIAQQFGKLAGELVQVRGVMGTVFNQRHQFAGLKLFVPGMEMVKVLRALPADPFALQITPIGKLLQFSPATAVSQRVHVRGVVTMQNAADTFIQDETGGLKMVQADETWLATGDVIDAVGDLTTGGYSPVLQDAVLRVDRRGAQVAPVSISVAQALSGEFDGLLVQLEGRVIGRTANNLLIEAEGSTFQAQTDEQRVGESLAPVRNGS